MLVVWLGCLLDVRGEEPKKDDPLKVERGQMTFDAEGREGGRWHSRKPHVPSESSGLTIGRGYDMKHRGAKGIEKDLLAAGLSEVDAKLYAGAAGLSGKTASDYLAKNGLPEITLEQQKALFTITYREIEASAKSICTSKAVADRYGECKWEALHPSIQELIIDLRYRGDYTPASRKIVQPLVVKNDVKGLAKVMADRESWKQVPMDRFQRRADFMAKAE